MMTTIQPADEVDRVRRYTSPEVLDQIDRQIEESIRFHATQNQEAISRRIEELRREWSIERYLQINASTLSFFSALLGLTVNKKWALLACGALGFFFFHAVQGFDPPMVLLRRKGIRTRKEIDREIYALKVLRGDFSNLPDLKVASSSPAPPPTDGNPPVSPTPP